MISNSLPKQDDTKKLLSHSVEIKRRTIIRGDKYNNIQITHIISVSKQNTDNNFHIIEKLSTSELNKKPLDLTKIKLYIKKDPNAKSYYNTSCRNVPLKSAEKILKTTYYFKNENKKRLLTFALVTVGVLIMIYIVRGV